MARAFVHTVMFVALVAAACTKCFSALQDNWTVDFVFEDPPGGIDQCYGIGVDSSDRVYVANLSREIIYVFAPSGAFQGSLVIQSEDMRYPIGSSFSGGTFLVGADDRLHVVVPDPYYPGFLHTVYAVDGARIGRLPYNIPYFPCAIDANGDTYLPVSVGLPVEVYSADGTHLRTIGGAGTGAGDLTSFNGSTGVAITPDGRLLVVTAKPSTAGGRILLIYSKDGQLESRIENAAIGNRLRAMGLDGLLYFDDPGYIITPQGNVLASFSSEGTLGVNPRTCALYLFDYATNRVSALRRSFRTLGAAAPGAVPLPVIRRTVQRLDGLIDLECFVTDPDSPEVSTALCAYKHGSGLLRDLVRIPASSLAEGTSAWLGSGVTTGTVFRLTWDASISALPTGNVTFELFANDGRPGILDIDYVTIPGSPALTISRSPITHGDLRAAWAWLLATGDAELSRTPDGEITGPGGAFTTADESSGSLSLPGGSQTTDAGRAWLFARFGAREATPEEITRARQAAAYGPPNQFTPASSARVMGDPADASNGFYVEADARPMKSNEWTIDTWDRWGSSPSSSPQLAAWWLVPLP